MRSLFILISSLLFVVACDSSVNYRLNVPVHTEGWNSNDTLVFNIDSISATAHYDLSINIRSSKLFPYQKLWLVLEQRWEYPLKQQCDTLPFRIVNERGKPIGEGISINEVTYPLPSIYLQKGQKGQIRVRHFMKDKSLKGITDIGISVLRP